MTFFEIHAKMTLRMRCYGTHTASTYKKIFDHLQNVHTYLPIDAEFHADFKNVYFCMPILRLSQVVAI